MQCGWDKYDNTFFCMKSETLMMWGGGGCKTNFSYGEGDDIQKNCETFQWQSGVDY